MGNPFSYMHSSKVADFLLYVNVFTYLFQILADASCLRIVQCQSYWPEIVT